jgi:hypothetical protein
MNFFGLSIFVFAIGATQDHPGQFAHPSLSPATRYILPQTHTAQMHFSPPGRPQPPTPPVLMNPVRPHLPPSPSSFAPRPSVHLPNQTHFTPPNYRHPGPFTATARPLSFARRPGANGVQPLDPSVQYVGRAPRNRPQFARHNPPGGKSAVFPRGVDNPQNLHEQEILRKRGASGTHEETEARSIPENDQSPTTTRKLDTPTPPTPPKTREEFEKEELTKVRWEQKAFLDRLRLAGVLVRVELMYTVSISSIYIFVKFVRISVDMCLCVRVSV